MRDAAGKPAKRYFSKWGESSAGTGQQGENKKIAYLVARWISIDVNGRRRLWAHQDARVLLVLVASDHGDFPDCRSFTF